MGEKVTPICFNSSYRQTFYDLIRTVVSKYDIDGIYFDTWVPFHFFEGKEKICYCDGCRKGFKEASGMDIPYKENPAPARQIDDKYLVMVHSLVLNETEAEFLTGLPVETDSQIREAAKALLEKGPQNIIITLGAKGAFVLNSDRDEFLPGFKVEAVDTTAAGDVYCGNLAVAIVEGKSIFEAVRFASAAAAISVTRLGAQPSAPKLTETIEFLKIHSLYKLV